MKSPSPSNSPFNRRNHSGPILLEDKNRSGIYIHVPFCQSKCDYCDFYSFPASSDRILHYLKNLNKELEMRSPDASSYRFETIYFGGGTPSLLGLGAIETILSSIHKYYKLAEQMEITLEVNPEQGSLDFLNGLAQAGVNRVSCGIQSTEPERLRFLGRWNQPEQYLSVLDNLQNSQIKRKNIDLMYGIPGQSKDEFYVDILKILRASPDHLSLYALTSEEETPYATRIQRGEIAPDEQVQVEIFLELPDLLAAHGFRRYEVSNYSIPGHESKHNYNGWNYLPYFGFGPGAHGFDGEYRWFNGNYEEWSKDPGQSARSLHNPLIDFPLGILRIAGGIDLNRFKVIPGEGEYVRAMGLFQKWSDMGLGHFNDSLHRRFHWKGSSLLHLDDRILEMIEVLQLEPGDS